MVDLRGIKFSRELRARSGSALTVHRTVIHSRTRSIPSNAKRNESTDGRSRFFGGSEGNRILARTARSVRFGSDGPPDRHSLPNPFDSLRLIKETRAPKGAPVSLVDLRGIEPLSENSFIQPSSRTVARLKFPFESAGRQALSSGSPFLHDRLKCERPMHVHR